MEPMTKFEFAGPEWIAALREALQVYTNKVGPQLDLTICEIFTNVPKHLDKNGDGVIAWHCHIHNGHVHFEETAIAEADVHTKTDYNFILPVARRFYTPDVMDEVNAYTAKGAAEGKMISTSKNRTKVPAEFIGMHNDLALRTL
jgi:hypothetical protein